MVMLVLSNKWMCCHFTVSDLMYGSAGTGSIFVQGLFLPAGIELSFIWLRETTGIIPQHPSGSKLYGWWTLWGLGNVTNRLGECCWVSPCLENAVGVWGNLLILGECSRYLGNVIGVWGLFMPPPYCNGGGILISSSATNFQL